MKRLQRRTKRNNITSETSNSIRTNVLSTRVNNFQQMLSLRWQALSPRDQLALAVVSMF